MTPDGTLTDSIAAVEAAWAKVAPDIGQDLAHVIAATHGKRAMDNLAQFKSHIAAHEMDAEVSSRESDLGDRPASPVPPAFVRHLAALLVYHDSKDQIVEVEQIKDIDNPLVEWRRELAKKKHMFEAWQAEAAAVDRSVRILPGVKRLIPVMDLIPEGRNAVATSGAKTYAHGCMTRVCIVPPAVTSSADDKRLKAGKPAPDPFLLAAKELGYDATQCVVFEDSPSGIRAGVASWATVIEL